jgi:uncharacterized protein DUF4407
MTAIANDENMEQSREPAIFLSPVGWREGSNRVSALAKLLGLDVWGTSLLNTRARREMTGAAIVLTIVFLFELTMWSALINVFVQGATWTVGARTLLAIMMAGILATGVLVFERGIVVADASARKGRFAFAVGARVLLIVVSALATSQPIELIVFSHEIDQRLRDEGVREEAVRILRSLDEQKANANGRAYDAAVEEADKSGAGTDKRKAEQKVEDLEKQQQINPALATLRGRESRCKTNVDYYAERLRQLRRTSNVPDGMIEKLTESRDKWNSELAGVREKIKVEEDMDRQRRIPLEEALKRQKDAAADVIQLTKERFADDQRRIDEAARQVSERRDWILKLQRSSPGTPVAAAGAAGIDEFNPYRAGFVRRHAVLADLLAGRPAEWPPGKSAERARAVTEFGIEEIDPHDLDLAHRNAEHTEDFMHIYYVAFLVALFIPLLTIAFKLVIGRELGVYYSTAAQARVGNPEARALLAADSERTSWPGAAQT